MKKSVYFRFKRTDRNTKAAVNALQKRASECKLHNHFFFLLKAVKTKQKFVVLTYLI